MKDLPRDALTTRERAFLDASETAEKEEAQRVRRRVRRLPLVVALVALLACAATTVGLAVRSQQIVTAQRNQALALKAVGSAAALRTDRSRRPRPLAQLVGPTGMVTTVAFARDNGTAITSGRDGTVRVWGLADRTRPAGQAALTGLSGGIAAVFSLGAPGAIVTLSHDRTIEIWNTDPSWALAHACRHVRAPLSRAQWSRHFPDLDYRPPCPAGRD